MSRLNAVALLACAFALVSTAADAKPLRQQQLVCDNNGRCTTVAAAQATKHSPRRGAYAGRDRIVAHPVGCPRRLFCGCGVSVKVFGHPVRDLFLAANWLHRFPRATPAPGMVAARRGHVFYIIDYLGNGKALAYDPNSGGRKTRIHVRSLAGYKVVDPHGGRVAMW